MDFQVEMMIGQCSMGDLGQVLCLEFEELGPGVEVCILVHKRPNDGFSR